MRKSNNIRNTIDREVLEKSSITRSTLITIDSHRVSRETAIKPIKATNIIQAEEGEMQDRIVLQDYRIGRQ